ncbi:hypothetical protein CASFOL_006805 [Castilleja foliolosa]|uniref:F-box domain-containing protein n=1 Tax=Castilleja foliolosa TaxID=1961234 RepID=A0ABD3E8A2_9LAMI
MANLIFEDLSELCLPFDSPTGDSAEKLSSSAQIVASIDDLIIEIIHRLPLKPLAQLRLVSNHWNSLISDPRLCSLLNRAAIGLIFEHLDKELQLPMALVIGTSKSCNGLLLCLSSNRAGRKYYVHNPTTGKYIALPQVVFDNTNESICGMCLAFDPSKSPHYRVVCVLRSCSDWWNLFKVYSSETGSWKAGELFKSTVNFDFENGVYWNGAIHWVNIVTTPREFVYFNLDSDQTFKVFPNPPLQDKLYERTDYYFGESCDHLHFVDAYRELDEFNVYEMKRDYSEWFVKYKVSVPEMKGGFSEWSIQRKINASEVNMKWFFKYNVCVRIHTVVRGKNDEDSFLVIATGRRRIARYNIEQKTCETLCDIDSTYKDNSVLFYCSTRSFPYIESINSI